jgi:hypothetical protein
LRKTLFRTTIERSVKQKSIDRNLDQKLNFMISILIKALQLILMSTKLVSAASTNETAASNRALINQQHEGASDFAVRNPPLAKNIQDKSLSPPSAHKAVGRDLSDVQHLYRIPPPEAFNCDSASFALRFDFSVSRSRKLGYCGINSWASPHLKPSFPLLFIRIHTMQDYITNDMIGFDMFGKDENNECTGKCAQCNG